MNRHRRVHHGLRSTVVENEVVHFRLGQCFEMRLEQLGDEARVALTTVVRGDVKRGAISAFIEKIEPFRATRADENVGVAPIPGELIHRCQSRASGNGYDPRPFRWIRGDTMRSAYVCFRARLQAHQRLGKLAQVDHDVRLVAAPERYGRIAVTLPVRHGLTCGR